MERHHNRGFSILEILVALLLVALFLAIAVPTINSLTRVKLKETSNQMLGLIRDTYSRSSLSDKVYRIVFDLDKNQYWVEVANENAARLPSERIDVDEDEGAQLNFFGQNESEQKYAKPPSFVPVEDDVGKKQQLPSDIKFFGIWADHLKERTRSGQVGLYFFPDGYTQRAQISLTDDESGAHALTLVVEPLTGEVVIENGEPEIEE